MNIISKTLFKIMAEICVLILFLPDTLVKRRFAPWVQFVIYVNFFAYILQDIVDLCCNYNMKRGEVCPSAISFSRYPCSEVCPTEEREGFPAAGVPWTGVLRRKTEDGVNSFSAAQSRFRPYFRKEMARETSVQARDSFLQGNSPQLEMNLSFRYSAGARPGAG